MRQKNDKKDKKDKSENIAILHPEGSNVDRFDKIIILDKERLVIT